MKKLHSSINSRERERLNMIEKEATRDANVKGCKTKAQNEYEYEEKSEELH